MTDASQRHHKPIEGWEPFEHIAEACALLEAVPGGMSVERLAERTQQSIAHSMIAQNKMIGRSRAP